MNESFNNNGADTKFDPSDYYQEILTIFKIYIVDRD